MKIPYKFIVFDVDGTLVDTMAYIVKCLEKAALDLNLPVLSQDRYKEHIGLGFLEVTDRLYGEHPSFDAKRFLESYRNHFFSKDPGEFALFEGAVEILEDLLEQDFLLGIATSKSRKGLEVLLKAKNMGHYFIATKTASDAKPKPHPQMLLDMLNELNLTPDQALMVGDSIYDVQLAKNAGMDSVAVTHGASPKEALLKYKPVYCVDSLLELLEICNYSAS